MSRYHSAMWIMTALLLLVVTPPPTTQAFGVNNPNTPRPAAAVAFVGSANQDLTCYTNNIPVLGETVLGQMFETSSGGKGANQARAGGRLQSVCNVDVSMICRVGNDVFGTEILETLAASGVSFDHEATVLKDGTSSGVATIVVDTKSGDNMIIVTPGANLKLSAQDVDDAMRAMKPPPAVVATQLEIKPDAALQAMKTGKMLGAITLLNTAPAPTDPTALDDFYAHVDILIPNETELRTICGKIGDDSVNEEELCKSLLQKGVGKAVVCTLGARGALIVSRRKNDKDVDFDVDDYQIDYVDAPEDLPARKLPVQDTIGAGDAFCGAVACYLSAGLDLVDAAGLSCGFASMSVRNRGATYPTADELPSCLKDFKVPIPAKSFVKKR